MRSSIGVFAVALVVLVPCAAQAASATSEDRISLIGAGTRLTAGDETAGGAGEALGWIHNFDADSLLTLGAEHQTLKDAHWAFGSIGGALTRELGDGRYTFAAEAHEGAGDDGIHPLKYRIEAGGVTGTYFHQLSVQLEERRIDVETTHGHLPKLGVSYLWSPHWMTSFSYAVSAGGNLGTRLTSGRVDRYSRAVNLFAGGSYGRIAPTILGVGIVSPGHIYRDGYVGASKTFARRTDVSLTADYLNLSGTKRGTVTLGFIFHLGSLGAAH